MCTLKISRTYVVIVTVFIFPLLSAADVVVPQDRVRSHVSVRESPTVQSAIRGKLRPGDQAELIADGLEWYEVQLPDGTRGFVNVGWTNRIVSIDDPPTSPPKVEDPEPTDQADSKPPDYTAAFSDISKALNDIAKKSSERGQLINTLITLGAVGLAGILSFLSARHITKKEGTRRKDEIKKEDERGEADTRKRREVFAKLLLDEIQERWQGPIKTVFHEALTEDGIEREAIDAANAIAKLRFSSRDVFVFEVVSRSFANYSFIDPQLLSNIVHGHILVCDLVDTCSKVRDRPDNISGADLRDLVTEFKNRLKEANNKFEALSKDLGDLIQEQPKYDGATEAGDATDGTPIDDLVDREASN